MMLGKRTTRSYPETGFWELRERYISSSVAKRLTTRTSVRPTKQVFIGGSVEGWMIGRPIKRNVKRKHFGVGPTAERFSAFSPGDLFPRRF
jgi:hypothetical protein